MAAKRIIIGDSEISVPDKLLSMGVFPAIGIAIVVWLLLGLYSVGPDEVGVVQRFGEYNRVVGSGLNYHYPYHKYRSLNLPQMKGQIGHISKYNLQYYHYQNLS